MEFRLRPLSMRSPDCMYLSHRITCATLISRKIWTQVPTERPNVTNPELAVPVLHGTIEKKSMINLASPCIVLINTTEVLTPSSSKP